MNPKKWILTSMIAIVIIFGSLLLVKNIIVPTVHESFNQLGEVMVVGLEGIEDNLTSYIPPQFNCSSEVIKPTCLTDKTLMFKTKEMCNASVILCDGNSPCVKNAKTGLGECEIWNGWEGDSSSVDICVNNTCPDKCDALLNFKQGGECLIGINKCLYHTVFLHSDYPTLCPLGSVPGGSPIFSKLPASPGGITGAAVLSYKATNHSNLSIFVLALILLSVLGAAYLVIPRWMKP